MRVVFNIRRMFMKRMIFSSILVTIFMVLSVSGAVVKGSISDSATGLPISNVKVILAQLQGEREQVIDTFITGITGSYSFAFSNPIGSGFYIRTIASQHYFQTTPIIRTIEIDDTITNDIKLRRIPTKVLENNCHKTSQNITIRTIKSRLYVSGIKTGAVVDIYNLNGHLLFRTALPPGVSEVRVPGGIATAGYYQVKIRAKGGLVRSVSFITGDF
jgi:hypothetical protein